MEHRPKLPSVSERRLRQQHRPRLVAATCSLRLMRCSLPQDTSQPIAVEKLLEPTTQRNFVLKLHNRFALLHESDESASSIENIWKEGRNALKDSSRAGPSPQKQTPVDQRRDPRHHWRAPHSPPMWQQGHGGAGRKTVLLIFQPSHFIVYLLWSVWKNMEKTPTIFSRGWFPWKWRPYSILGHSPRYI